MEILPDKSVYDVLLVVYFQVAVNVARTTVIEGLVTDPV